MYNSCPSIDIRTSFFRRCRSSLLYLILAVLHFRDDNLHSCSQSESLQESLSF